MLDNKIPMPELIKDWAEVMPKFAESGATYNRQRLIELARTLRFLAAEARHEIDDPIYLRGTGTDVAFGIELPFATLICSTELDMLDKTDLEDIEHNMDKYIHALRPEETAYNAYTHVSFCFANQAGSVTTVKNLVFLVAVIAEELGITALDTSII